MKFLQRGLFEQQFSWQILATQVEEPRGLKRDVAGFHSTAHYGVEDTLEKKHEFSWLG